MKYTTKGIKEDVKKVKALRYCFPIERIEGEEILPQAPHLLDNEYFEGLRKEWIEIYRGRDFVKELLQKDSKLASQISVNAPEKVQKKINLYKKQKKNPQYVPEDIRELIKYYSLYDHIEAVWGTRFRMNACRCQLPEHNDKTASFHIYPNTNTFFCFGCHRGGSLIDFLMHNDTMGLKEAIQYIKNLQCTPSQIHPHSRKNTTEGRLF